MTKAMILLSNRSILFTLALIQICYSLSNKYKTPIKKNNKSLHQQSLLLNVTDVTSDDEEHVFKNITPQHFTPLYISPQITLYMMKSFLPLQNRSLFLHQNRILL